MATSKIEQIIEEIEQYITEDCKQYPLSKSKIIVDRDRMEELVRQLQMKMPDEIKRYRKILENRNAILDDAQSKADAMLENANANVQKLVSDHEIVQMATADAEAIIADAQHRAQQIVKAAQREADELKQGSLAYVGESLENLQMLIGNAMSSVDSKMKGLMDSMQNYYTIIEDNKNEIAALGSEGNQPVEDDMPLEPTLDEELQFADLSYE